MIFQGGLNVHKSASLFNFKEQKIDRKDSRIRTHDPDGSVYYANHLGSITSRAYLTTRPLIISWNDGRK